jgi:pimeloyl-ACP methyl ester carboxylesterase
VQDHRLIPLEFQAVATIVLAHGAWSSAWAWKKMRPLLRDAGHEFFATSYTGLGERVHLANPGINLDTHIHDVIGTLRFERLRDVVLVGHSYGGIVATGVAARARDQIRRLVYLDAFVPRSGQRAFDLLPPGIPEQMLHLADTQGDGWRVPAGAMPPDTGSDDLAWAQPLRMPQPIETLRQPLVFDEQHLPPRAYIYCTRIPPGDPFGPSAGRARAEGWPYAELDASHNPHITAPTDLLDVLRSLL